MLVSSSLSASALCQTLPFLHDFFVFIFLTYRFLSPCDLIPCSATKWPADFASSDYFENRMESIRSNEELSVEQLHQERVAAAWDTVALFLPQDYARSKGKVDPYVKRRIRHIVRACGFSSAGDDEPSSSQRRRSILDVGCGDGALFPYLPESAVNEKSLHYLGLDVSKEMVELGRKRNPGGTFLVGSFPQDVPSTDDNGDEVLFDCILFNGSLQFFRDQREVLQQAVKRLMPGGRIVLTHVNGGKFVQTECRTNPTVAVSAMPTREFLDSVATELGCTVIDQRLLLEKATAVDPSDLNADSFYLSVLENQIN